MGRKKPLVGMITAGIILIVSTSLWLGSATPVNAQCGSQSSSCKNCHEVQGEMPVNADGTGWHQSHAFGDFCYICHAGNNQATDKAEAHVGMAPPLSDIQASCQQCHVADLEERAQVYATTLGVDTSTGAGDTGNNPTGGDNVAASTGVGLMAPIKLDINDPNVVDYVQRYNALVLGEKPVNLGNLIVGGLIGIVLLGGGAFVIYNEGWVSVDFEKVDEYPHELIALLPNISRLTPPNRKKLEQLLADPRRTDEILSKVEVPKD